jgi:2-(1,2-epoxy-1,2-dihydrophenyl)acetyl-CoA isomerase
MTTDLITGIEGGVATVTFNRPDARNALTTEMTRECARFVETLHADPSVRCLAFRATGDHFSGGGDVRNFETTLGMDAGERREHYEQRVRASGPLFATLEGLNLPIVTIARGAIAGAGLSFVLLADVAMVSETAFFVFAHSRLGLSLDAGLSYYLPRSVGVRRARELATLAGRVDAQAALQYGMVSRVLADATLDEEADAIIGALRVSATTAIGESKRLINTSPGNDIVTQIDQEAEAIGRCAATLDFREGVSAFLEKRKTAFVGR